MLMELLQQHYLEIIFHELNLEIMKFIFQIEKKRVMVHQLKVLKN